jgi:hypothetical protein
MIFGGASLRGRWLLLLDWADAAVGVALTGALAALRVSHAQLVHHLRGGFGLHGNFGQL